MRRLRCGSESAVDRVPLLRGQRVGACCGGVIPLPRPIIAYANDLDRGKADEDGPENGHPAAGKQGAEPDAEHGAMIGGLG